MNPIKVVKIKTKKEVIKEPYPGWKKQATTVDRPTKQDKKLEQEMMESLGKEDFYGKKKLDEIAKKAVADRRSEEMVKKSNAIIAAKLRAEKEKKK